MPALEIDVSGKAGAFPIRAQFSAPGGITGLFGPSGAGKTSVLKMIAGVLQPDNGRIAVEGRMFFDAAAGVNLPPERRAIGFVFQESRLFPHMNVTRNLTYSMRMRGAQTSPRFDEIVEVLDLRTLLERIPKYLSGGEKQRVAIGRALLSDPKLLIMDEPLSSVDMGRRDEILPYLRKLRDYADMPVIYVSHDADEMIGLADNIVIFKGGAVTACGPAKKIKPLLTN
jgi:molybdate transport system ATP-binding protein